MLAAGHNSANITTKGTLVVRDIDVLQELARVAGCGVSISLITLDEAVWRAFEPGTPPPRQRLTAMRRLVDAGVPCGLALAPVLPKLTDAPAALEAVVRAAAEHGAQWLWSGTLHLEPAVRDWFLGALARHLPPLLSDYQRVYGPCGADAGARYTPKAYSEGLSRRIAELKARYNVADGHRSVPRMGQEAATAVPARPPVSAQQISLPLCSVKSTYRAGQSRVSVPASQLHDTLSWR